MSGSNLLRVLKPYYDRLLRAGRDDPVAATVAVLLLHHIDDFNEAMDEGKHEAALASQMDIEHIVNEMDSADRDRIALVFADSKDYSRFIEDLSEILWTET